MAIARFYLNKFKDFSWILYIYPNRFCITALVPKQIHRRKPWWCKVAGWVGSTSGIENLLTLRFSHLINILYSIVPSNRTLFWFIKFFLLLSLTKHGYTASIKILEQCFCHIRNLKLYKLLLLKKRQYFLY